MICLSQDGVGSHSFSRELKTDVHVNLKSSSPHTEPKSGITNSTIIDVTRYALTIMEIE